MSGLTLALRLYNQQQPQQKQEPDPVSSPPSVPDDASSSSSSSSSSSPSSVPVSLSESSSFAVVLPLSDSKCSSTPSTSSARPNEHLAVLLPANLWKPDSVAAHCDNLGCRCKFSIFERRHHCRKCGGVFCRSCSSRMTPLLDTANLPFQHPPRHEPISSYENPCVSFQSWEHFLTTPRDETSFEVGRDARPSGDGSPVSGGGGGRDFLAGLPLDVPIAPGQTCLDNISQTLATTTPGTLTEVLAQMKAFVITQARTLLVAHPQLAYALFQALLLKNIIDPAILHRMLNATTAAGSGSQGPSTHPAQSQRSQPPP